MVAMKREKINLYAECRKCSEVLLVPVYFEDVEAWRGGKLIQDAMPYLSADERELLISETCGPCFDKMFGDEQ